MSGMVNLRAENIRGGEMLRRLNEHIMEAAQSVVRNYLLYGTENGHTPKAEVTLKITITKSKMYSNAEYFDVDADMHHTAPRAPKIKSLAMENDGKLVVDQRGSDMEDPRQQSFIEPGDGMFDSE